MSSYPMAPLRRLTNCLDGARIPLNAEERSSMVGDIPYWGAGSIVDHVDRYLFKEELVLLGEDGAPFFDVGRDVAFRVTEPVWVNNHIHVLRPNGRVDGRFLTYALNAVDYSTAISGATRDKLTQEDMKSISVPLPLVEEQRRIADFLDDQVARIDQALSLKVEQSIQLEEARVSRMTTAILSSTDNVVQLRRVLARRPEYGANEAAEFEESSWPRYIRTTDVTPEGELRAETFRSLPPDVAEPYLLTDGDVLFTRSGATVGKSFIYRQDWGVAAYAGYLIRVTADRSCVLPEWIKAFSETTTYWDQIGENAIQATIQNVSADRYSSLLLPVPDVATQRSLVSQFAEWTEATRSLTRETVRSLALLEERKRALITAAVTGELDVTTAKPIGMGKWVPHVGAGVDAHVVSQASSIGGIG